MWTVPTEHHRTISTCLYSHPYLYESFESLLYKNGWPVFPNEVRYGCSVQMFNIVMEFPMFPCPQLRNFRTLFWYLQSVEINQGTMGSTPQAFASWRLLGNCRDMAAWMVRYWKPGIFIWVPHCDLTGIMVNKGNHPQMALIQVSEIL